MRLLTTLSIAIAILADGAPFGTARACAESGTARSYDVL
jgi:hypothetical protein